MAANKLVRLGPVALSNVLTTNIINPPIVSGGVGVAGANVATYLLLKHIRIVNKTAGAVSFSLYLGATGANAAGSEFMGLGNSVPANSYVDWYGQLRLDTADFIVGGASALTSLTFQAEGEIGVL